MVKVGLQFITGKVGEEDNTIYTISEIGGGVATLSFTENGRTRTTAHSTSSIEEGLKSKKWTIINKKDVIVEAQLIDKTAYINELFFVHVLPLVQGYDKIDKKLKTEVKGLSKKLNDLLQDFKNLKDAES